MAKVLKKLGRLHCHCCGKLVVLREQGNGLPIYMCAECDYKGQAFSSDSGKRLIDSCVDRFGEAANDGGGMEGHLVGDKSKRTSDGAPPVAGQPEKKSETPKRQSLGAALAAAFE